MAVTIYSYPNLNWSLLFIIPTAIAIIIVFFLVWSRPGLLLSYHLFLCNHLWKNVLQRRKDICVFTSKWNINVSRIMSCLYVWFSPRDSAWLNALLMHAALPLTSAQQMAYVSYYRIFLNATSLMIMKNFYLPSWNYLTSNHPWRDNPNRWTLVTCSGCLSIRQLSPLRPISKWPNRIVVTLPWVSTRACTYQRTGGSKKWECFIPRATAKSAATMATYSVLKIQSCTDGSPSTPEVPSL